MVTDSTEHLLNLAQKLVLNPKDSAIVLDIVREHERLNLLDFEYKMLRNFIVTSINYRELCEALNHHITSEKFVHDSKNIKIKHVLLLRYNKEADVSSIVDLNKFAKIIKQADNEFFNLIRKNIKNFIAIALKDWEKYAIETISVYFKTIGIKDTIISAHIMEMNNRLLNTTPLSYLHSYKKRIIREKVIELRRLNP
jgi:hypothetical protein